MIQLTENARAQARRSKKYRLSLFRRAVELLLEDKEEESREMLREYYEAAEEAKGA